MFFQRTVAQALFTDPYSHEGCLSDVSLILPKVILGLSRPAKLSPKLAFSLQLPGGGSKKCSLSAVIPGVSLSDP